MGISIIRKPYSDTNSFSVLHSLVYNSTVHGSLVTAVSLSLNLWRPAFWWWILVGDVMVSNSVSVNRVNRLVLILEFDASVIVDATPRAKTRKQGRIVMIVATITAVKISDMARVFGVVLYPGSVMKWSRN